ncbi:MAG: hypothetical protein ACLQFT_14210 [Steroidobacteraceae bacterium]
MQFTRFDTALDRRQALKHAFMTSDTAVSVAQHRLCLGGAA